MSNWSSFIKKIPINAAVSQVYNMWATQDGLESWFLRSAEFKKPDGSARDRKDQVQKGDNFTWLWHGYDDNAVEKRKVINANGKDQIQFTFSGDCLVTVTLSTSGNLTICELRQENIPEDNNPATNLLVGCGEGWTFYLTNLKSTLEGGIDLRNKDISITGVINS